MSHLMKRFCRFLQVQVIDFFKILSLKVKLGTSRLNTCECKKAANLGKLYLLPKIHNRLSNVPVRPVISHFETPAEKAFAFLDYHLKNVMQKGKS